MNPISAFVAILCLCPDFHGLKSKVFESGFLDCRSSLFDKIEQKPEVVQSGDAGRGWFFDLDQMTQVSATKAVRHGVCGVERLIISGVFRILEI